MEKIMDFVLKIKNFMKANKKMCYIIGAILIVLIAILVIISAIKGSGINKICDKDNMNLSSQQGKWIYYIAIDNDENVGINKIKDNGKKTEKLYEGNVQQIDIQNKYIYFIEENDGEYNLAKVKNNGKKYEILAKDIDNAPITVTDKYVLYFKGSKLYKMKLNGTEKEKMIDKYVSYYQIADNWIYYIYENNSTQYIARMKLNGNKNQRISKIKIEDGQVESLYVKGNKIYYIESKVNNNYDRSYYLCKMNKKGEKVEQVCKLGTDVRYISMQEDKIYYTVSEDYNTHSIYSIKYNGTNKEKIKTTNRVKGLNINEKWIVFSGVNDEYDAEMRMITLDGKKEKQL